LDVIRTADSIDIDFHSETGSPLFPFKGTQDPHNAYINAKPWWFGKITVFGHVDPRRVDPIMSLAPKKMEPILSPANSQQNFGTLQPPTPHNSLTVNAQSQQQLQQQVWRPSPPNIKFSLSVWLLLKSVDVLQATHHHHHLHHSHSIDFKNASQSIGGWDATRKRLWQARELAWTCVYKLTHGMTPSSSNPSTTNSSANVIYCPTTVDSTHMTVCFRFQPQSTKPPPASSTSSAIAVVSTPPLIHSPRQQPAMGVLPSSPALGAGLPPLALGGLHGSYSSSNSYSLEMLENYKMQMEEGTRYVSLYYIINS
jgi:hypothetical protein